MRYIHKQMSGLQAEIEAPTRSKKIEAVKTARRSSEEMGPEAFQQDPPKCKMQSKTHRRMQSKLQSRMQDARCRV